MRLTYLTSGPFGFGDVLDLIVTVCLFSISMNFLPRAYQQIIIQVDDKGKFMKWDGCLYRKVRITEDNQTSCYKCTVDESQPTIPISLTDWSQEFINCTEFCDRATICTKAKYYSLKDTPPVERPLCYQCENKKNEDIRFESKYYHELCPLDCQRCAQMVDLSDAVQCAPICKGYPTFCFPNKANLGETVCHQATFWYGCKYIPIFPNFTRGSGDEGGDLTENCQKCAREAGSAENARYCTYACSAYPTYYNGSSFLQCRAHAAVEDKNNDLFLYNIPSEIMKYLHMSNASYLYPAEIMDNKIKYLDGHIARQIYRKFNIANLNNPLPYKYRIRKSNHEALKIVSPS